MKTKFAVLAALAILAGLPASAETITWSGDGDGVLWRDPANWDRGRVPGNSDDVRIDTSPEDGIRLEGAQPLVRSLYNGAILRVQGGLDFGNAVLEVNGNLTNAGVIHLTSTDVERNTTLAIIVGTMVNRGSLVCSPGTGGSRTLTGKFVNDGTLTVEAEAQAFVDGELTQRTGVLEVAATGQMRARGTVQIAGGEVLGEIRLYDYNTRLELAAGDEVGGRFVFLGSPSGYPCYLSGPIASGQTVVIQANPDFPLHEVVATGGLTNSGVVRFDSVGGVFSPILQINNGRLENRGRLGFLPGTGGLRRLSGEVRNEGIIYAAGSEARIEAGGVTHQNAGTVVVEDANLVFSGSGLRNLLSGTISGDGTIECSGSGLVNEGSVSPGLSSGTLTIKGTYQQAATARLLTEIGGTEPGVSYDRLAIEGPSSLDGGTLVVGVADGFLPTPGQVFSGVLTSSALTGEFGGYEGLAILTNLSLVAQYDGQALGLRAALASNLASPPAFVTQPRGAQLSVGERLRLTVVVTGTNPFTYQWRRNGQSLPGAINATYEIPAFRRDDAGTYTVVVSNEAGAVESDPGRLSPTGLPILELVDDFEDRKVFTAAEFTGLTNNLAATFEQTEGEPRHAGKVGGKSMGLTWRPPVSGVATFDTIGSGFDTLLAVYQGNTLAELNRQENQVASDEDRGGFFTSLLSFNAVAGSDYQIAVDGFAGARGELILSWTLKPNAPPLPVVTEGPTNQVAVAGSLVTLTVASPTPGVRYQWFLNGQELAGEESPTLEFTAAESRVGNYRVRVTSADGSANLESVDASIELAPADQPVAPAVSADKRQDAEIIQLGGTPGPPMALHDQPRPAGGASPAVGARFASTYGLTRSDTDPPVCGALTWASRWFRFQVVDVSRTVKLSLESNEVPVVRGVYDHAEPQQARAACLSIMPNTGPWTNSFVAVLGKEYDVMVAAVTNVAGGVWLRWDAEKLGIEFQRPELVIEEGRLRITWPDLPGGSYELRMADRLEQWQGLFLTNVTRNALQFLDTDFPNPPARFYHLRQPPP